MIQQIVTLGIRNDSAGQGHFGAPRGSRRHKGIDYVCHPGQWVLSPVDGKVTKHGQCYSDDTHYRYIEVTDSQALRHRLFYTSPMAPIGALVNEGQAVARAQDVSARYPDSGMLPHIHFEILDADGNAVDPQAVGVARGKV